MRMVSLRMEYGVPSLNSAEVHVSAEREKLSEGWLRKPSGSSRRLEARRRALRPQFVTTLLTRCESIDISIRSIVPAVSPISPM